MTDKLTPGQLRDLARLFGLPLTVTVDGKNPQTLYPTAHLADLFSAEAGVREEAARREDEARQEPFKPCHECINPGTCARIGCYQATNASAATPPAADAPKDRLIERLKKYEELGPLSCLAVHPETPGYTTGEVLGDTRDAIARIEADARKIAAVAHWRDEYYKRVAELEAALLAVVNDPCAYKLNGATIRGAWSALANKGAVNG